MFEEVSATLLRVSAAARHREADSVSSKIGNYLSLTKPEVNVLILITTAGGFYLASLAGGASFSALRFFSTVAATLLLASGAATLNQVMERRYDALMRRTMRRPIAAGLVPAARAFVFGVVLAIGGSVWLLAAVNATAGFIGLFALGTYLLAYTPLKRRTPLCTAVGALAGAVPPLIGWFACGGRFDAEAATLYALLFFWQFPHVMSIAAIYSSDYQRAGYRIIPQNGNKARFLAVSTILPCVLLLALLAGPAIVANSVLSLVAAVLGGAFLLCGIRFAVRRTTSVARELLTASILYVPLAFVLLIAIEKFRGPAH